MKKYKALMLTIPKNYDFSEKLHAIETDGMFAYHYSSKKPKHDYDKVLVLHNGMLYVCQKHDTDLGIGFKNKTVALHSSIKGFQGFRYIEKLEDVIENTPENYEILLDHYWKQKSKKAVKELFDGIDEICRELCKKDKSKDNHETTE